MVANISSRYENHVRACLAFGVIGDAKGTPTENLEPAEIEARFGWVDSFEGDGTDDTIMRDLIASALIRTRGYADADSWAEEWRDQQQAIFGGKVGRFFPSVLHAAARGLPALTIPTGAIAIAELELGIVPSAMLRGG